MAGEGLGPEVHPAGRGAVTVAARVWRLLIQATCAAAVGVASLVHSDAVAGSSVPPRFWLDAAVQDRQADVLHVDDIEPLTHGSAGFSFGAGAALSRSWAAEVRGSWGGSWLDFERFGETANIKNSGWTVAALGMYRWLPGPGNEVALGAGFEYFEYRSRFNSPANSPVPSDPGPHTFAPGGVLRLEAAHQVAGWIALTGALSQSIYRAHAEQPSTGEVYHWLGRALGFEIGVRLLIPGS